MASLKRHEQAIRNVQAAINLLAEKGGNTILVEFDDLNGVLGAIETLEARVAELELIKAQSK